VILRGDGKSPKIIQCQDGVSVRVFVFRRSTTGSNTEKFSELSRLVAVLLLLEEVDEEGSIKMKSLTAAKLTGMME
jgi:hypothetical protein